MSKKILILSSSPRKGGNSDLLCDRFAEGAREAGMICGLGVYEKGEVREQPVWDEAYHADLRV